MPAACLRKTVVTLTERKFLAVACALLVLVSAAGVAAAQKKSKKQQEPTTGGISGRVRVDAGATPGGVSVVVRRGEEEVARQTTSAKGEFEVQGLGPGSYGITLRKAGLQVGRTENIEVRAGKTVSLKDRIFLPLDEGSLVMIRGSVFNAAGLSFAGARVELARVESDGSVKKLDSRVSNSTGSFGFRLMPEHARYRLTAKADGMEAASEEINVEGAAIYRVALSLGPTQKQ
jgi:opacity protein-like surface antigen